MPVRPARLRTDSGNVLVLFALTMTVLFGMAGFAVDAGLLIAERRDDQTAVDTGVLGGALDMGDGFISASEAAASIARSNLRTTYTDAEWAAAWGSCVDDEAYTFTGTVLGTDTDCISTDGSTRLRMRLPDQEVDAVFASVFGFKSFTSSAVAEAELVNTGLGGILPFAVLGSATSGSQLCMRSSSGGGCHPTLRRLDIRQFWRARHAGMGAVSRDRKSLLQLQQVESACSELKRWGRPPALAVDIACGGKPGGLMRCGSSPHTQCAPDVHRYLRRTC